MRGSLLVESFDLLPRSQYILVWVIPSCFRFAKMCLCQVSLLSRCSPRYLISSSWGSCTLFIWIGGHVYLRVVNVRWIFLDPIAFIFPFLNLLKSRQSNLWNSPLLLSSRHVFHSTSQSVTCLYTSQRSSAQSSWLQNGDVLCFL
jgi:hypothetical protein